MSFSITNQLNIPCLSEKAENLLNKNCEFPPGLENSAEVHKTKELIDLLFHLLTEERLKLSDSEKNQLCLNKKNFERIKLNEKVPNSFIKKTDKILSSYHRLPPGLEESQEAKKTAETATLLCALFTKAKLSLSPEEKGFLVSSYSSIKEHPAVIDVPVVMTYLTALENNIQNPEIQSYELPTPCALEDDVF